MKITVNALLLYVGISLLMVQCTLPIVPGYKRYLIDETHLTYQENGRRYINTQAIADIDKGKVLFHIRSKDPLYIKALEELHLKSGWRIQGKTGREQLIKEQSNTTSAIVVKDAEKIVIQNFQLGTTAYIPTDANALIDIDNNPSWGKGVTIRALTLKKHFSAIWVKRGKNISIKNCLLDSNAHQVYLGFIHDDPTQRKNYRVEGLSIKNCMIGNSLGGESDGIKTLSNCHKILIKGNTIFKNNQDGIDLFPGGVDVEIVRNTIRDNKVHGIEVKMTNQYTPEQTGQIKRVIIKRNQIINNGNNGIACLDKADDYYAQGVEILNNTIDSSGHYGIFTEYPIKVTGNTLTQNGLKEFPTPTIAYTGIYFLNVRSGDTSLVFDNQIINQAPRPGLKNTFWMTVTEPNSYIRIIDNKFLILPDTPSPTVVNKYGIGFVKAEGFYNESEARTRNTFSLGFTENVSINLGRN